MQSVKVEGETLSPDSSIIGTCNENPTLNTMTYDVEFQDINVREHMANMIAEIVLTRTDDDAHVTMALQTVLDHRKDDTACDLQDE